MSAATVLQSAANRFSRVAGFAPISVDGNIGPATLAAVKRSLNYLAVELDETESGWLTNSPSETAAELDRKITSALALTQPMIAAGVGTFLLQQADRLKLPAIAGPMPSSGGGGFAPLPSPPPILATSSILDTWRALATWKKILIGALAGVGVIWLWGRYKTSRGLSGTRLYLFTYRNKHNSWSDVWATDIDHARDQIKRRKNASGFFEISRVRNVPAREVA